MRIYLKDLRKKAGLNQTQVAKYLGITQVAVALLENGRNKTMSLETASKLADLYGCDIRDIVEGEKEYGENLQ